MKILVQYHDGAVPLTILPQGDWIDLCAAEKGPAHRRCQHAAKQKQGAERNKRQP